MSTSKDKYVLLIGGPTAGGKTTLAIEIAHHFGTEIISADSRQIYKELTIGTAVPSDDELGEVHHHLIQHRSIHEPYNAGIYEKEALSIINDLHATHELVVVVGGTGLYLQAISDGLDYFPEISTEIRQGLQQELDLQGLEKLSNELLSKDPEYGSKVDLQNSRRVLRALEIIRQTGRPFSSFKNKITTARPFQCLRICTQWDRQTLYDRINSRVDAMINNGLIKEARSVYPYRPLASLQTVGYKELFKYFDGEWDLDTAIDKIKQHSRNYAKRQMTWFRNQGIWQAFNPTETDLIIRWIESEISNQ